MSLSVSHLTVTFGSGPGRIAAVRDVSFEAREGEFLTIIGPSGCGKTTLLRTIAGLVRAPAGNIRWSPARPDPNRRILLVFQEHSLFPWLTVLENASFGLKMQAVGREEREARATALLGRFGLGGRERAYPHQLSLGMKQRVAVIRTFLTNPAVMLMDEPFAALDAQTRSALQQELLALWEQSRTTVIFVTHDIDEALLLSDRIVILNGPPATIVDDLEVPFCRPRAADLPLQDEFLHVKRALLSRVEGRNPVGCRP